MKKLYVLLSLFGVAFSNRILAQSGNEQPAYREADAMFKKTVVRALDLREKQNSPYFTNNKEITKILIDAVKSGEIIPYTSDTLDKRLTIDEFTRRMEIPSTVPQMDTVELYIEYGPGWRAYQELTEGPEYYFPRDFYQIEITEDIYFDKRKSRMYYDIKAITIFVPADHPQNIRGIQQPVASFDYKQLEKGLLKNISRAPWMNAQNDAGKKSMADAFKLRLFSSYIVMVSNPAGVYLVDMYMDEQTAIMAAQWANLELMEYEHSLWEF